MDYYSPGKTKYRSAPEVEKVLRERGMRLCFQDESSESDGYHATESDNEEKLPSTSKVLKNSHHEVEQRLCVCESTQICKFVEDINKSSRCSTEECDGMFFSFLKVVFNVFLMCLASLNFFIITYCPIITPVQN